MSQERVAAIDIDEIGNKSLDEISAADFLSALNQGGLATQYFVVWPEKKKVELWSEPENIGKLRIADLFDRLRAEKKKYELEKHPGFENVRLDKTLGFENWLDPRESYYRDLLDRFTQAIEAGLSKDK
ncbi:MAG: hypothetical protein KJZ86_16680 [Caldilineaceae bacterium]|nr:hypothetical protein [Caldilineaceae bacterium]